MESKRFTSSRNTVTGREIGRLVVAVSLATSLLSVGMTGLAAAQGNGKGRGQEREATERSSVRAAIAPHDRASQFATRLDPVEPRLQDGGGFPPRRPREKLLPIIVQEVRQERIKLIEDMLRNRYPGLPAASEALLVLRDIRRNGEIDDAMWENVRQLYHKWFD